MIDRNVVKKGLDEGLTRRQIARINKWSRVDVEDAVRELDLEYTRRRNKYAFVSIIHIKRSRRIWLVAGWVDADALRESGSRQ